jgi:cytochrome c oxidase cbb3-type subunit 2
MLSVADESGTLFAHYHTPPVDESAKLRVRGPLIEYLNPRQLANFTRNGLVTEISEDEVPQQRRTLPEPVAPPPSPRYRMTGRADALWVTDSDGKQHMHIFDPVIAGATHGANGPVIEWISADQAAAYLAQGYIEQIGAAPAPAALPAQEPVDSMVLSQEAIDECVRSLDRLGVPADAGAPTARAALREGGDSYSNATIALAVRARKALSETAVTP